MKNTILASLLCAIVAISAHAQSIDSTFTTNGFVPYGGSLSNDQQNICGGNRTVRQPDGKLVVAENWSYAPELFFYTYRYNADGTPDATFGTNGVSAIFCGSGSNNRDVALQPDGKIVVTGATEYCVLGVCGALQFVMMRLKTNGELDSTFGNNGKIITTDVFGSTGLYAIPGAMKILPDGKFIVGGRARGGYPCIVKLNNNGFPDNTFATNGVYNDSVAQTSFIDLAINDAGDILVLNGKNNYTIGVGSDTNNLSDNYILKLTPSGVRDNTFGTAGRFVFSVSNADHPTSIAIKNNQSIVVVGDEQFNNTQNYNWNGTGGNGYGVTNKGYIAFINANGTMASNIPGGHKSIKIPTDSATFFHRVIVLSDNRLFVSGRVMIKVAGNYLEKAILTQIDGNGNFIPDFHTTGYWVFDYGVSGTSGWPGRICSFNDIDVTAGNEAYATGRRNHTPSNTGTCLFFLKLKNVPTGAYVGIPVTQNDAILSLYPNPVHDVFSLESNDHTTYTIRDVAGRTISTGLLNKGRNDIQLPASTAGGAYFISDDKTGQAVQFIKK